MNQIMPQRNERSTCLLYSPPSVSPITVAEPAEQHVDEQQQARRAQPGPSAHVVEPSAAAEHQSGTARPSRRSASGCRAGRSTCLGSALVAVREPWQWRGHEPRGAALGRSCTMRIGERQSCRRRRQLRVDDEARPAARALVAGSNACGREAEAFGLAGSNAPRPRRRDARRPPGARSAACLAQVAARNCVS